MIIDEFPVPPHINHHHHQPSSGYLSLAKPTRGEGGGTCMLLIYNIKSQSTRIGVRDIALPKKRAQGNIFIPGPSRAPMGATIFHLFSPRTYCNGFDVVFPSLCEVPR